MGHQVNPAGFRLGKTFLWNNSEFNNLKNINLGQGLNDTLNSVLQRSNLVIVKTKSNISENSINVNALYYPLVAPILRSRTFPMYTAPRATLTKSNKYNSKFRAAISKIWATKTKEFNNRFVRKKRKMDFNKLFSKAMFRGSKSFLGKKSFPVLNKNTSCATKWAKLSCYYKQTIFKYQSKKNKLLRWRLSKNNVNSKLLAKQISKRLGVRVNLKLQNVFSYILKKSHKLSFKKHQRHIWNKRYNYNKKRFTAYYDIVNSLYLLCNFNGTESLVLKMIQHGLVNMHRRKIRPKNMFYFLNSVVKNMKAIQKEFNAFRLVITGKLRGGTSRTKTFSTGFGVVPRQTLDKNINYAFGDVHSKYGAFGVKILTWRKSMHETMTDRKVKWTIAQQRRLQRLKKIRKKRKKMFKGLRKRFSGLVKVQHGGHLRKHS